MINIYTSTDINETEYLIEDIINLQNLKYNKYDISIVEGNRLEKIIDFNPMCVLKLKTLVSETTIRRLTERLLKYGLIVVVENEKGTRKYEPKNINTNEMLLKMAMLKGKEEVGGEVDSAYNLLLYANYH